MAKRCDGISVASQATQFDIRRRQAAQGYGLPESNGDLGYPHNARPDTCPEGHATEVAQNDE
jgi:hypothetical protein